MNYCAGTGERVPIGAALEHRGGDSRARETKDGTRPFGNPANGHIGSHGSESRFRSRLDRSHCRVF